MPAVIEFHDFCAKILKIKLTTGQRVIAKVAFGDYDPVDLEGDERELALQMFGGVERVSKDVRKYVLLSLGRGSGKTTICSAYGVYSAVTADISKCGPGDVPYVIVVAPDKATAKLSIRMSREMIRSNPALERLVISDTKELIEIRRPDSRMVRIEAFAATRGGSAMRGRTVITYLLDEAEFFNSNGEGRDYAVNDKDIIGALKPRLLPLGKGMMISTPWPVETVMGTQFEENWGKCLTAIAIKAPTILVRGDDPDVIQMVNDEMTKDPENARRELYCEREGVSGQEFFDPNSLLSSITKEPTFPLPLVPKWPVAVGCDLGFTRDSSAITVVQWDGHKYKLRYVEELRPKPGKPLKPSDVISRFAEITKKYGAKGVVADAYYRESLKEHLDKHGLVIYSAPEGTQGKAEVYQRTRSCLHEGLCELPDSPLIRRMVQQAKLVTSKPAPGGTITIKVPRRVGLGHGDIVSSWVLAIHHLAWSQIKPDIPVLEPGTEAWIAESNRRIQSYLQKQQDSYLKNLEKSVRKGMNGRQLRYFSSKGN